MQTIRLTCSASALTVAYVLTAFLVQSDKVDQILSKCLLVLTAARVLTASPPSNYKVQVETAKSTSPNSSKCLLSCPRILVRVGGLASSVKLTLVLLLFLFKRPFLFRYADSLSRIRPCLSTRMLLLQFDRDN